MLSARVMVPTRSAGVVGDGGDFGRLAGRGRLGDAGQPARAVVAIIPGRGIGVLDGGQVAAGQRERGEPAGRVLDRLELVAAVIGERRGPGERIGDGLRAGCPNSRRSSSARCGRPTVVSRPLELKFSLVPSVSVSV